MLQQMPWEKGEKPVLVNDGFEWYIDRSATSWALKDNIMPSGNVVPGITGVMAFIVRKGGDISYVLVDGNQNVLADDDRYEQFLRKIDILKVINNEAE